MAEIIIAKHRNGEVTDVPLRFIKDQAKFADADSSVTAAVIGSRNDYRASEEYVDIASGGGISSMGIAPSGFGGGMSSMPNEFDIPSSGGGNGHAPF